MKIVKPGIKPNLNACECFPSLGVQSVSLHLLPSLHPTLIAGSKSLL